MFNIKCISFLPIIFWKNRFFYKIHYAKLQVLFIVKIILKNRDTLKMWNLL